MVAIDGITRLDIIRLTEYLGEEVIKRPGTPMLVEGKTLYENVKLSDDVMLLYRADLDNITITRKVKGCGICTVQLDDNLMVRIL